MSRINIGDINSATFKVGNVDCQLYLGDIKLYPTGPHDYSQDYFTIVSESNDNTISILKHGSAPAITVSASTDNGQTWTEFTGGTIATLNTGNKLLLKGVNNKWASGSSDNNSFISTSAYHVEGNIMSLLFGENFSGQTDLTGKDYVFCNLFSGNTNVTSAENLVLPATTLANYSYWGMFFGCSSLTTAPELPATTLASTCYSIMFHGCTSLTTAPELPATTLATSCYQQMFVGCTSLTTAPELSATMLATGCYYGMFYNCTGLTTAPELPATTLANSCYGSMFSGCTSLTTAPELPATTLEYSCYRGMFSGCTSLNYIKCLATDISANGCTTNWVNGVAASGTFVKAASMTSWTTGNDGIPSGWTVVDETYKYKFALTDQSVVKGRCTSSTTLTGDEIYQYKDTLEYAEVGSCVTTLGQNLFKDFTNLKTAVIPDNVTNIVGMTFQGASGLTSVSLPNGLTSIPWYMFQGCKSLSAITIPSGVTSIGEGALNNIGVSAITIPSGVTSMGSSVLRNCSGLTSIDIPSGVTNLSNASFMDDVSLEQVTLHEGLVSIGNSAFWNCVSISSITIPDSVTSIDGYVFFNCTNLANINLGSGLTNIGIEAFKNCYNLSSIDIPSGVTNIGNSAFYNCVDLLSITMNSAIPPTIGEATFDNSNECPIYVPAGSVESYKTAWPTYAHRIQGGSHDYSLDHFTIVSEADNNTISILKNGSAPAITVSASTDDGQTWTTYSTSGTIATLNTGDKLLLKGVNNKWGAALVTNYNKITASASFHVEGNIMSLLYGDNFVDQTSISGRNYAFQCLFEGVTTLTSAENLILPATTLASDCYGYMFNACTSLTAAPELPATTLVNSCYRGMLQGCSSLTKAPELPAPTLTTLCYAWLFNGCTSLNHIKCLATNKSASRCTDTWVNDVSATGTFVKDPNMSSWTTGINGIPSGWTVQDNT